MSTIELRLPPVAQSVAPVRQTIRDWLCAAGVAQSAVDDTLVVVSELVTNGVIHDGGDDIVVWASSDQQGVSIEVTTNDRPADCSPYRPSSTDPIETGRGLLVVAALADRMSIETHGDRRAVTCQMALPG